MSKIDFAELTSFFFSSLELNNRFQNFESFKKWFVQKCKPDEFKVGQIPFEEMEKWSFDANKTRLSHESGKFFSIEGIHIKTNFGKVEEWEQPIINQPEIGILGIITKVFDGVRYFLMQAKMEPGNINTLQLSPSVQATKSNFSRVHKGKTPAYLEYFNGEKKVRILVDQLQTEQGGRFYQKRNRNIIIEIQDEITVFDDFCWLTLGELKALLREDNVLNMDTRSVLSTIPLIDESLITGLRQTTIKDINSVKEKITLTGMNYIRSYVSDHSLYHIDDIISWYNQQKINFELEVKKKSLSKLDGWKIDDYSISKDESFFSVIGVEVTAGSREVTRWMQPLLKDEKIGLLAFILKEIDGVIHFLIQAKVEPGNKDIIELSPTVSCSNYQNIARKAERPFLFDEIFNTKNRIYYDTLQSEEGGRFYRIQNRNMIVELDDRDDLELPSNYIWMTLRQMKEFMRYGMFNIEARSLISSISFI